MADDPLAHIHSPRPSPPPPPGPPPGGAAAVAADGAAGAAGAGAAAASSAIKAAAVLRGASPTTLFAQPIPLVYLMGCTDRTPELLKYVADGQAADRLHFTIVPFEFALPKMKTNPPLSAPGSRGPRGYENYQPAGILKAKWSLKHRLEIPSLLVLFFEWTEGHSWASRELTICDRVASVRGNNRPRELNIMVVIICDGKTKDQNNIDDKLANIRKRANLDHSKKSVFALNTDDLRGSLAKLKDSWEELSSQYYLNHIRRIKKLKDRLNASSQPAMFVRHHFKIAYYYEFLDKLDEAIKYYRSAYQYLLQIQDDVVQVYELKNVAYLVNFKMCRLYMRQRKYGNAAEQFYYHMQSFSVAEGLPEISFRHSSWLAQQYRTCGDLFTEFPSNLQNKDRRHHPGFYYQNAAKYAVSRQEKARVLLRQPHHEPDLKISGDVYFYGQSHSREQGRDTIADVTDAAFREERLVNHSEQIISLLTKAYDAYKTSEGSLFQRSIQHVVSLIAKQHFANGNYEQCQDFLSIVAEKYRSDGWHSILTENLRMSLECARQLDELSDIVAFSLELMQKHMTTSEAEKKQIQQALLQSLERAHLDDDRDGDGDDDFDIYELSSPNPLVACATSFTKSLVEWNDVSAQFEATVVSSFPSPIKFSKIEFRFSRPEYTMVFATSPTIPDGGQAKAREVIVDSTSFQRGKPVEFRAPIHPQRVEHDVEFKEARFYLSVGRSTIILRCPADNDSIIDPLKVPTNPIVRVIRTTPKLQHKVEVDAPALLNEFFAIRFKLDADVDHVDRCSIGLFHGPHLALYALDDSQPSKMIPLLHSSLPASESSASSPAKSALAANSDQSGASRHRFNSSPPRSVVSANLVKPMRPGDTQEVVVFGQCSSESECKLSYQITYDNPETKMSLRTNGTVSFNFVSPFKVTSTVLADSKAARVSGRSAMETVLVGDTALVNVAVANTSDHRLLVRSMHPRIQSSERFKRIDDGCLVGDELRVLDAGAVYSSMFLVSVRQAGAAYLGDLDIVWQRTNSSQAESLASVEQHRLVSYQTHLCSLVATQPRLSLDIDCPTSTTVGEVFDLAVKIRNFTQEAHQIEVLVQHNHSQCFVSGKLTGLSTVGPQDVLSLPFKVVYLGCGHVKLPQISVKPLNSNELLRHPESFGSIYVKPHSRIRSHAKGEHVHQATGSRRADASSLRQQPLMSTGRDKLVQPRPGVLLPASRR